MLADELGLEVTRFKSGPLGGDQQDFLLSSPLMHSAYDRIMPSFHPQPSRVYYD